MNATRSLTAAEITTVADAVAGWHAEGRGWCRLAAEEKLIPCDGGEFRCVVLSDRRTVEPAWSIFRDGENAFQVIYCDDGEAFTAGSLEEALSLIATEECGTA